MTHIPIVQTEVDSQQSGLSRQPLTLSSIQAGIGGGGDAIEEIAEDAARELEGKPMLEATLKYDDSDVCRDTCSTEAETILVAVPTLEAKGTVDMLGLDAVADAWLSERSLAVECTTSEPDTWAEETTCSIREEICADRVDAPPNSCITCELCTFDS